jgi:hypothetical protein
MNDSEQKTTSLEKIINLSRKIQIINRDLHEQKEIYNKTKKYYEALQEKHLSLLKEITPLIQELYGPGWRHDDLISQSWSTVKIGHNDLTYPS